MAAQSRRTDPSVERLLFEEGYRFDFFQAVRVLERLYPHRQPVGHDMAPADEVVRFRPHLSLSFPPSAIHRISRADAEARPAEMLVAFMGLTGPQGVLPRHYTELLLEHGRKKDHALRDFLDLFTHRLISFFYRAWEKYRVPVAYERALLRRHADDRFSTSLYALIGMGTKGLRNRLEVNDRTLLSYTGLLAQQPRSASALASLLSDYFAVPVRVIQFVGEWLPLTPENRSRLGPRQAHNALGMSAVAGSHVWDQQATFRLRIGPLTLAAFRRFLPSETAFRALVQLSRFFVGQEDDFEVQLVLQKTDVPRCHLGGETPPRLGWSAWLTTGVGPNDAEDAIFPGNLTQTGPRAGQPLRGEGERQHEREP